MPGLLMTTSQANKRLQSALVRGQDLEVTERGRGGLSSTRTGTSPIDSRRRRLAVPSTPRPQRPTDALMSADQEISGGIAIGDAMGSDG